VRGYAFAPRSCGIKLGSRELCHSWSSPPGYKFGDYWRMGLPLEILVVALGVPVILMFWPL